MSKNKFNNDIYNMYEKEVLKNEKIASKYNKLKWEVEELRYENKKLNNKLYNVNSIKEKEISKEVQRIIKTFIEENQKLKEDLLNAYDEINRLKSIINNTNKDKDYLIDKLNNQVNKNSTNSGIPTSKEISNKNKKTGVNTYNHRKSSSNSKGGQINHKGKTLTKENLENKISKNNIEVRELTHYINGNLNDEEIIKYKVGIETKMYVEKHIFISIPNSTEKLPKSFYSDVTYNDDLKILSKYGRNKFTLDEIKIMEQEYDKILSRAKEENEKILSSYWKEKTNTLLNRCIKYKNTMLFYLHDFTVPYDNNFME